MTTRDPFDRLLGDWLATSAPTAPPAGLHRAVIERAARSRQRPAWVAGVRVGATGRRATTAARTGLRLGYLVAVLLLLVALLAAVAIAGSQRRLPSPFGLAGNGLLAFEAGARIYVAEADGTAIRALPAGPGDNTAPTWSPDGRRLAFWSTPAGGGVRLTVTAPDGSDPVVIPLDPIVVPDTGLAPSWSPDGRRLVFAAAAEHGIDRLFIATLEDRSVAGLTTEGLGPANPAWSPDGRLIAFVARSGRDVSDVGLYVIGPDGADLRRLPTSVLPNAELGALAPRWAPDAERSALLYVFGPNGGTDVGIFDLATGHETVVSSDPANEFWATWSPDATHVAWYGGTGGIDSIRVADIGGGYQPAHVRQVLVSPSAAPGATPDAAVAAALAQQFVNSPPFWSPDGTSISGFDGLGTSILVVAIDGTTAGRRVPFASVGEQAGSTLGGPSWQRVAP
jgi:hypothetical protein